MKCQAAIALVLCFGAAPAGAEPPQSFRTDILPILTKAGCNAGACHGAATGQGGFKLSLLGYDPEEDHDRITREFGGRRIATARAEESLLLRKPSEEVEHEGGRRLRRDSDGYEALRRWIAAGAPRGPGELHVTGITVDPADSLVRETGRKLTLRVTASLSDGSQRDVTALALYSSNDDAIAGVTKSGEITTAGRGLTSIMVRYSGQVAAARVAVPFGDAAATGGGGAEFPSHNFVDGPIGKALQRMGLPASALSTDAEFLRRVYLDVTGCLPSSEEARDFAKTPATAERRAEIIESLLAGEEFVDLWTMRLADLLLAGGKGTNEQSARAYHDWIRRRIQERAPLDSVVRTLLTATGGEPANFFALSSDPRDLAEHVSRMFLGTQIACARCHAHPGDRWTQDDYHRFAAGFARIRRDGGRIQILDRGEVEHPKTGRPLSPKPLGAPPVDAAAHPDRRVPLAAWITSPDNPFFARSLVNRVWKHLLGRGLVEPVDDLRPTNPATHPDLLDALAADFTAHHFDLRHLIRTIVSSRTYQLSSKPLAGNKADDRLYSHALVRELPAQVFMDAVARAAGVPDQFPNAVEGARAVQLASAQTPSYALDVLGRCARDRSCESPVRSGGGIARALHLINGDTIQQKLRGGILDRLFKENAGDEKIISELYLRTLTRLPEPAEHAEWSAVLSKTPAARREAAEDLLWTLLNSREFGFNH